MERQSEDKVLAGIAHLGIVVGWVGVLVALIIYLLRKEQSIFIRRSVTQALGYQVCALVIMQVLVMLFGGGLALGIMSTAAPVAGMLGLFIVKTINLGLILLGLWGAVRAFLGTTFRYPIIGDFIARL